MPGCQQRSPLRLLSHCPCQSEEDPKRINCPAPTWEASCPLALPKALGIHGADSPKGKLVFWLCLHRAFTVWLHSAKVKVERLLLLKTNGVDPCSVLEKERRKRDKGVALRVQAFWVRRACLGVSLGCRAYSGRPGYQGNYTLWAKRGDLGETAQHFGEVTDWLEATLCSCYPSVPCYPQDTHPPNLHMHFADVCVQKY